MKKIIFAITILALVLAVTGCLAESIFELLPEDNAETTRLTAPAYGALACVDPDQVEQSAEGGKIVTYRNVDASGFNRFGKYLGKLGFTVTGQEKDENRLAYSLTNGQVDFVMIYEIETGTMQLIYPQGTDYAENLFPGYTRIDFDEEIRIPARGKFTFHDFVLNGQAKSRYAFRTEEDVNDPTEILSSWLPFSFYNTASSMWPMVAPELFDATLVYITDDGEYPFRNQAVGSFMPEKKLFATHLEDDRDGFYFANWVVHPLSGAEGAASFVLPDDLRASTGGTIAIKLEFPTGEKYVLVIRENGVDLNLAAPAVE